MSLDIAQREQEGIVLIDLKGHLTLGAAEADFQGEPDKLVRSEMSHVVLNLNDVSQIDTAGLGTLLFAVARIRGIEERGRTRFACLSRCADRKAIQLIIAA
jgi:anti-anti-sigma factor